MDFTKYITEGTELLAGALFILGVFLKNTKKIKDEYIPFILLVVALALRLSMNGLAVESVLDAIFATGTSVLTHQLIKQTKKLGED